MTSLQEKPNNAALAGADIVERLRESDNDTEYVSPIGNEKRLTLPWEAAKEIEGLRHALMTMLGDTDESDYMTAAEKRATAYAAMAPNA